MPDAPVSSLFWTGLFMAACYAMAASCIYRGIREARGSWSVALSHIGIFAVFAALFWALESWAHYRTPYYLYSGTFADLLPRIPIDRWGDVLARWGLDRKIDNGCARRVVAVATAHREHSIPLSIPLLEASLTYSAMWTARRLGAKLAVQPFLAALILVSVDSLLDPVAARTYGCDGLLRERTGIGIGLWNWYVDPSQMQMAEWYAVPLFNYATWFVAPAFLIALVNFGGLFFRDVLGPRVAERYRNTGLPRSYTQLFLLATMVGLIGFLFWIAPEHPVPPEAQRWGVAGLLGVGAIIVLPQVGRGFETEKTVDITLTRPVALALLLPALALCVEGFFVDVPKLIPVGLFAIAFGLLFVFLPYRSAIRSFHDRLTVVYRFVRLQYFSFASMLILLGAATVSNEPDKWLIGGLLLIALSFQIYCILMKDVVDLDIYRGQPEKTNELLRTGAISKDSALALSLVQVPVAAVITLFLIDFAPRQNPWPLVALGAGFASIWASNSRARQRLSQPLIDLVQGLGWAMLVVYGALVADPEALVDSWEKTAIVFAYGTGFILLVGGVRDAFRSTWKSALIAFAVHTAIFALAFGFVLGDPAGDEGYYNARTFPWILGILAALFAASSCTLYVALKGSEPDRNKFASWYFLFMLLLPMALYLVSDSPREVFRVIVSCSVLLPLALRSDVIGNLFRLLYREPRAQLDPADSRSRF